MAKLTPMMEQYFGIKNQYKNCILFFRLGDFYEMFFEDAIIASKVLDITLTGRDCGMGERAPMCGIPFHSADGYIAKLVENDYKVAICEQVEDAKLTKTIVKREVVRVVTKGTILDTNVLDEDKNNFVMCIFENESGFGLSVADISTGEFLTTEIPLADGKGIIDEIAKYSPAEIISNESFSYPDIILNAFDLKVEKYSPWAFEYSSAYIKLVSHFNVLTLDGFGLNKNDNATVAAGALLEYLYETQKNSLNHILSIRKYSKDNFMSLDISSRRNLELTETIRDKTKKGSLLSILDKTQTSMGGRMLRKWLESPLINVESIKDRQNAVEELKDCFLTREELKEMLNTVYDLDRIMSRIVYKTANAKDFILLKNSIDSFPAIKLLLSNCKSNLLLEYHNNFNSLKEIFNLLDSSINDDPPFSIREGGFIKKGYNEELDVYLESKSKGKDWLLELENKERENTKIKNLKIKYNRIFGYYFEVTNSYKNLVPDRFIRKQTMSNAERFFTDELKEIEEKILGADEKIVDLEYILFQEIQNFISNEIEKIQTSANIIASLDSLISLAETADKNKYVKPILNTTGEIEIKNGRHPVVEFTMKDNFIPNDTLLNSNEDRLAIITGPNMSGKSTYMRQTALIVLLAQIGSFVPAEYANISIVDRIFTRVGASDDLATGQSTFMIEMSEVANILNNATKNSLLILDEIGRGTSTFDGLSIAWSVLEYIADKVLAKTLFATHYHELTELEGKVDGVKNYCIQVEERGEDIIFLRKIIRGGAEYSYGIHVAKLAGVPKEVIDKAKLILNMLNSSDVAKKDLNAVGESVAYYGTNKNKKDDFSEIIINELINLDVDALTPREALTRLYELKNKSINKS